MGGIYLCDGTPHLDIQVAGPMKLFFWHSDDRVMVEDYDYVVDVQQKGNTFYIRNGKQIADGDVAKVLIGVPGRSTLLGHFTAKAQLRNVDEHTYLGDTSIQASDEAKLNLTVMGTLHATARSGGCIEAKLDGQVRANASDEGKIVVDAHEVLTAAKCQAEKGGAIIVTGDCERDFDSTRDETSFVLHVGNVGGRTSDRRFGQGIDSGMRFMR